MARRTHHPVHWYQGAWAVLLKDLRLELRSRYALNTLFVFVLGALLLVALAVSREDIGARAQAGLLWIVILFAAALGLGRSFIQEQERGTALFLRLHTTSSMVYAGKLVYNSLLGMAVNFVSLGAFIVLSGVEVAHWSLLLTTILLGTLGLSGTTTILAAIIARTSRRGALLPVLLFPLLVPLLMSTVDATRKSFAGGAGGWAASVDSLMALIAFTGVVITASVLLFDHVWHD